MIQWYRSLLGRTHLDEDKVRALQEDFTNIAVDWAIKQYPGCEVRTVRSLPATKVMRFTDDAGREHSVYLKKVQVSPEKRPDIWRKQSLEAKEALRRMGVCSGRFGKYLFIYRKGVDE